MSTHEHMEHAEHAEHAAHDPFDKRVALTIAIVAAILASVTVLAHRAHTDTLLFQAEANLKSNESFDKWAEYQARKNRQYADLRTKDILELMPASSGNEEKLKKKLKGLDDSITEKAKKVDDAKKEAEDYNRQARNRMHDSHAMHERASRYDLGELFVEVALVLCSIAILTKRKSFWFSGIAVCVLGAVIAVTGMLGLFMSEGHSEQDSGQHSEQKDSSHQKQKDQH
jgi:hypothetical protein